MSEYHFCARDRALYLRSLHGDRIPEDAVPITSELYAQLVDGRAAGLSVEVDENGSPFLGAATSTPTPPRVVTKRQALLALFAAGKLDAVEAVVQQSPRPVQIAWEAARTFERDNPLIQALAPAVGLGEEQLDELFAQAALL